MTDDLQQITVGSVNQNAAAVLILEAGQSALIVNPSTTETVWYGNNPAITPVYQNAIPLLPQGYIGITATKNIYAACQQGVVTNVYVIPGGSSFFQPTDVAVLNGSSLFIYNGTPSFGNPPIAALTANADDSFGNSVNPGDAPAGGGLIVIGQTIPSGGTNPFAKLIAFGVSFPGLFLGTGDVDEAVTGYVESEIVGSGSSRVLATTIASPTFLGDIPAVFNLYSLQEGGGGNQIGALEGLLQVFAPGGSDFTHGQIQETGPGMWTITGPSESAADSPGVITLVSKVATGLFAEVQVPAGVYLSPQLIQSTGGTAAFPSLITTDTWHNITLDSGWTAGSPPPGYRLNVCGDLQLRGSATHAAFTSPTSLNSSNPLVAPYVPHYTQYYRSGDGNRSGAQANNNGQIEAYPISGGSTQVDLTGIVPLGV